MSLFLETYTIPHDIPAPALVRGLRQVNRGTEVTMLRCGYSLSDGVMWCVTDAPSEEALRRAVLKMDFAFTLESVRLVDSPDAVDRMPGLDAVFDPRETRPSDVSEPASRPR